MSSPGSAAFPPAPAPITAPESVAATRPRLSVIVKCLNEEKNLGACLDSILAATSAYDAEVIVADAASTDRSVEIARGFPVRVVQFEHPGDRNCGATAQLGWQFANGDYILLVDGDMEVMPGFLPVALAALDADPALAAVGGRLIEMSESLEFQERRRRVTADAARDVPCVTGCGLYRAAAIRAGVYFMDRNLHCFEELDLGGRLRSAGWRLRLLDVDCVRHHGHRSVAFRLIRNRWRARTLDGYGEFLRAALGSARQKDALRTGRFALLTIGWWASLLVLGLAALRSGPAALLFLALAVLPFAGLLLRKRNFDRAAYAWVMWQVAAASLLRGWLARRIEPRTPLRAVILHEPGGAGEER